MKKYIAVVVSKGGRPTVGDPQSDTLPELQEIFADRVKRQGAGAAQTRVYIYRVVEVLSSSVEFKWGELDPKDEYGGGTPLLGSDQRREDAGARTDPVARTGPHRFG